ncbi:MAG: FAD:protein FMN transferase [Myxococcota bacterium]
MRGGGRSFGLGDASPRWWGVLAFLALGTVGLYGSSAREGAPERLVLEGPTMGTTYRVTVRASESGGALPAREVLLGVVERELGRVVALMSTYDAGSEISRFNASPDSAPFRVSPETRAVLEIALEVGRRSGGAFDITVGPLVELWGFGRTPEPTELPGAELVATTLEAVGADRLRLGPEGLTKDHPRTQVDLSAVAKGYAVDRVADALERIGVGDFLVEVGGELRGRGERTPGEPFRVAVESPEPGQPVHGVVALADRALATSGNYRNVYVRDGERVVHTLSPRTGRPVAQRLLSASVVHRSCAWADAWATALMASGDAAWELAEREGLDAMLLFTGADGSLEERRTAGFPPFDGGPRS